LTRGAFSGVYTLVANTAQWSAVGHHIALATERTLTATTDKVFGMPTVTLGLRALV